MAQALRESVLAISLVALALLGGCALGLNKFRPYNQYAGQTVTLREPMVLIKESEPSAYSQRQMVRPADTDPSRIPSTWTVLVQLPIGTTFTITSVKWIRTDNAGGWVLAIGNLGAEAGAYAGKKATYYWGDEDLNRAPWEDPSVPSSRHVGRHGRQFQP